MFAKLFAIATKRVGSGSCLATAGIALFICGSAFGETFAWRNYTATSTLPASPNWQSFGTASNWAVGTDKNGSNPNSLVPGAGDYIYYGANNSGLQVFDLDGQTHTVGGLTGGYESHWSPHLFLLRNGTLECTTDFSNRAAHVYIYDTGRFILSKTCAMLCGGGGNYGKVQVYSGGEADLEGTIRINSLGVDVASGGTMTFRPKSLGFCQGQTNAQYPSYIRNEGTFSIPGGFTFAERSNTRKTVLSIEQKGGTLTLGGNLVMGVPNDDYLDFILSGGTVNVTNDVAFVAFRAVMMTNDATATVTVSAGKTFDLSPMVFENGTSLTKAGAGTLKIGSSAPESFLVSAGTLHLTTGVALGDCLTLAPGTTLLLASVGISADSIAGLADANVALDVAAFGGGSPVFRSSNATFLATLLAKLGEAPSGFFYSISGDTLWLIKEHDATVFTWKNEFTSSVEPPVSPQWQSFGNPANWAIGTSKTGNNPDSLIPGSGDSIYYGSSGQFKAFDLDGATYSIRGITNGWTDFSTRTFLIRNGTLTIEQNFTNRAAHVYVYDAGRFVLGENCCTYCGQAGAFGQWHIYAGGSADIGGNVDFHRLLVEVEQGGEMEFHPSKFAFINTANRDNGPSYVRNCGTLSIPGAVTLSGRSGKAPCVFVLEQAGGSLVLGGNLSSTASADYADFILSGGTISATNDVAFSGFRTILMTNDTVAVANVSAGKTLDLTKMAFASGTSLTKTGAGTVKLKVSVPAYMAVSAGTLEVTGAASFANGISLAPGTTLRIAVAGVYAASVTGIADANIVFDESLFTGVTPLFVSPDAATLSAIREKLGTAPEGCTYRIDGDTLVLDKPHEASLFYWKKEGSAAYYSFYDPSYWGIGDTADATNPNALIPGEDDEIYYGNVYSRYMYFDMKGTTRTIKALSRGMGPNAEPYGMFYMNITNGTLAFTSCFTNFRAYVVSEAGGRFVLGEDCFTKAGGSGAANRYIVKAGGECDLGGTIDVNVFQSTVSEDGRLIFRPKVFRFENLANSSYASSFISNSGVLEMPNGFTMGGKSGVAPCLFVINQNGGTLTLGGDLTMTDTADYADFVLAGGTVNATNDVSFNGFHTVMMTNDATAVVCVADGKTLDFSVMSFESGTALSKTGGGTLKIGASVPDAIAVDTGILSVSGAAAFGEGLSLGSGSTLHFAAGGTTAGAIAGIEDASVTFDAKSVGYGSAILTSTNETLIATVADKMAPAIAAADKPKLFLVTEVSAGDPAVRQLRLMRIPKGAVLSFR